jgi:hypothetical protein
MNKTTIILIGILLGVISIINFQYFIKKKNQLKKTVSIYKKTISLAKEIELLNNNRKIKLNFCKTEGNIIECNNLNKNLFKKAEYFIFKKDLFLKSFDIEKEKNVNLKAEINE